ncbi:RnfH family protein [Pasteurella multocida]|uniref:RnfH family protein n=1 Tax=Pasteurella multocida TaxID=747 RepID=UPI003CE8E76B
MAQIKIEIAYAYPERYYLKKLTVEEGTMIQTAILQSGILQQFTEIDLRENKVGIFSRPAKLTDQLKDGDRIEIYRPLLADPKEIRRKRAEQQAAQAKKINRSFGFLPQRSHRIEREHDEILFT